jgi:hypothetical protein
VPSGKSDAGTIEWKTEVILPVTLEIIIVASVRRPDITALEDTSTVIGWNGFS